MSELPSIFDARGAFQELPSEVFDSLDDAHRATYQKIQRCAADIAAADKAVAASIENIKTRFDEVRDFEKLMAAIPQPAFMDLWRESKQTRASGQ